MYCDIDESDRRFELNKTQIAANLVVGGGIFYLCNTLKYRSFLPLKKLTNKDMLKLPMIPLPLAISVIINLYYKEHNKNIYEIVASNLKLFGREKQSYLRPKQFYIEIKKLFIPSIENEITFVKYDRNKTYLANIILYSSLGYKNKMGLFLFNLHAYSEEIMQKLLLYFLNIYKTSAIALLDCMLNIEENVALTGNKQFILDRANLCFRFKFEEKEYCIDFNKFAKAISSLCEDDQRIICRELFILHKNNHFNMLSLTFFSQELIYKKPLLEYFLGYEEIFRDFYTFYNNFPGALIEADEEYIWEKYGEIYNIIGTATSIFYFFSNLYKFNNKDFTSDLFKSKKYLIFKEKLTERQKKVFNKLEIDSVFNQAKDLFVFWLVAVMEAPGEFFKERKEYVKDSGVLSPEQFL